MGRRAAEEMANGNLCEAIAPQIRESKTQNIAELRVFHPIHAFGRKLWVTIEP